MVDLGRGAPRGRLNHETPSSRRLVLPEGRTLKVSWRHVSSWVRCHGPFETRRNKQPVNCGIARTIKSSLMRRRVTSGRESRLGKSDEMCSVPSTVATCSKTRASPKNGPCREVGGWSLEGSVFTCAKRVFMNIYSESMLYVVTWAVYESPFVSLGYQREYPIEMTYSLHFYISPAFLFLTISQSLSRSSENTDTYIPTTLGTLCTIISCISVLYR